MPDLREQLQACCQGRVCLIGIGNVDLGDDGFGVRLAEELARMHAQRTGGSRLQQDLQIIVAGTMPERFIGRVVEQGFSHVLFLDAVEFGANPGDAVLLKGEEIAARFPQISTHKLSLGLLAKWVESNQHTKAALLGVQPESLRAGQTLSSRVQATLDVLCEFIITTFYDNPPQQLQRAESCSRQAEPTMPMRANAPKEVTA